LFLSQRALYEIYTLSLHDALPIFLYRQKGKEDAEVFLDPNKFSTDGTTSLAGISFSKDGSLAAYQISEGGSDWRKVIVLNTKEKDRKSTRLNSSHVKISYAVFCLK